MSRRKKIIDPSVPAVPVPVLEKVLLEKPARLLPEEAAKELGVKPVDLPILVSAGLIKPLASPSKQATKYFATIDVLSKKLDRNWIEKATAALYRHGQKKNNKAKEPQHE